MNRKKETFVIKNKDGNEVQYAVLEPSHEQNRELQKVYNRAFSDAVSSGALLRRSLNKYMIEQGLWDEQKENRQREIINRINENELKLQKGGIKLTEARNLAIEMRQLRNELRNLIVDRNALDINTAEGQAENARFNAMVAMCLVYNNTGEPVYKNTEEYYNNGTDEVAFRGAELLSQMMYDIDKNFEANLPENKFLKDWEFVDENLRLVDKQGRLVDIDGNLVDEEGFIVNEDGKRIDKNGNIIDSNGNYVVADPAPFLDDDGNPIVGEKEEAEESTQTPKKRGRPPKRSTTKDKE